MKPLSRLAAGALLVAVIAGPAAAGEAESHQGAWRSCLDRNFRVEAALTDRTLAADAALRTCRPAEEAYLGALATSSLLDADDVARARPALAARARTWLLGGMPAPTRAAFAR
ncbi:hypothetical protein Q8W71_14990 [Methylobacterium sp. NEAU 140]|uniref:hypothetical protein n=1 Tax=Methylobacterium sp. NEAU 140 TaxID=3064945 RepID=UPI00273291DE|nr:hypothetical protein [Methylobacterium sp. NEAU 140]MDP4023935.1 hypothetical protein [Methylobacterium sp. NEAU 140]